MLLPFIYFALVILSLYLGQFFYAAKDKGQPTDIGVGLLDLGAPFIVATNLPNQPLMKLVAVTGGNLVLL